MASNTIERGLQNVPRGLPSGLSSYLQSLDAVVRRLAGMARNSQGSEAVRQNQTSQLGGSRPIAPGSITFDKLANDSVTEDKIAKYAVTTDKIANGSINGDKLAYGTITSREIADKTILESDLADDCISTSKIQDNSITLGKISPDVFDKSSDVTFVTSGSASDGDTIYLGSDWLSKPGVFVTGFSFDMASHQDGETASISVGIDGIQFSEDAGWTATASCRSTSGQTVSKGTLSWGAVGRIIRK